MVEAIDLSGRPTTRREGGCFRFHDLSHFQEFMSDGLIDRSAEGIGPEQQVRAQGPNIRSPASPKLDEVDTVPDAVADYIATTGLYQ